MSPTTHHPDTAVTDALTVAVDTARLAPSVHNTQPWQWRLAGTRLELHARRDRQLGVADPEGLLLAVSCGAALHHSRIALAARGWPAHIAVLPDPARPDLLAVLEPGEHGDPDPTAAHLATAVPDRRTDRRPVTPTPVSRGQLDELTRAASGHGIDLHILHPEQVVELTVAMANANRTEVSDDDHRQEIATWVGGERHDGLGIPAEAIPQRPPQTRVLGRYFGPPGTLTIGSGRDEAARYAILHGPSDGPRDWLRAGEALSALWLTATAHELSVLPISAIVEVIATRMAIRNLLAAVSYPYLGLRIGQPDRHTPPPEPTPRLPLSDILTSQP